MNCSLVVGEVVCGWISGMGRGRQLGELGLLVVLFTCLAASLASSRGCTSNVCLDFVKCLVPAQESSLMSDSEPPFRFCCSFNQFQPALCSFVSAGIWHKVRSMWRGSVYSWASTNPFVYPRTKVAAAAAAAAMADAKAQNAGPTKIKYEFLQLISLVLTNIYTHVHTPNGYEYTRRYGIC